MALIVENGDGVEGAQSYLSVSSFKSYADARGMDYSGVTDPQIEQALVRGSAWIDATYRGRFPGVRTNRNDQGLQWPRTAGSYVAGVLVPNLSSPITDAEGIEISDDEMPIALLSATAEAAYRELMSPGALAPDLERGGDIRRIQAGSVEIEYASTAAARTTFTTIDGLLADILIAAASGSGFTARAVRA